MITVRTLHSPNDLQSDLQLYGYFLIKAPIASWYYKKALRIDGCLLMSQIMSGS